MRPEHEIRNRIEELEESAEDAPDPIAEKLQAQVHILEWVLEGDFNPPEGETIGHLENNGEIFDQVILGARMGEKTFIGEKTDKPGNYTLIRRSDVKVSQ